MLSAYETHQGSSVGSRRTDEEVRMMRWIRSRPLRRAFDHVAFVVFGQRDPNSKAVGWLPGQGTHGGAGGQTPPYVPYNPDWDPALRAKRARKR
jgi:hypothetical protein